MATGSLEMGAAASVSNRIISYVECVMANHSAVPRANYSLQSKTCKRIHSEMP